MCKFNLVEVVLALMVVAIGIVGMLSMINIGIESNRDASMALASVDAADQFIGHFISEMKRDWSVSEALPEEKSVLDDGEMLWSAESLIAQSTAQVRFSTLNEGDVFDPEVHSSGVFLVEHITPNQAVDFSGVIRAWKEEVTYEPPWAGASTVPWGVLDQSSGSDEIAFGYTNGRTYTLKYGSGPLGHAPGNFGALSIGGKGADVYRNNIINGCPGTVSIGDSISSEPGNMRGPTDDGVAVRISVDPYIKVLVVTPFTRGRCTVNVIGFLPFKLVAGSGPGEVRAIYVGDDASTAGSGVGFAPRRATIHAEVSWPSYVPYGRRKKKVYSSEIFHPKVATKEQE